MAVFHFRLAQVLRLQQAIEDMEKRELQQKLVTLARAEVALAQAQVQRTRFAGDLQQAEASGLSAAQLMSLRRWHPVLTELEAERQLDTITASEAADAQRQQVQQARLEKRTLEQLQERQREKFDLALEQREQTALDELAVQSWPSEVRL